MILNDAGRMVEKWYYELENKYPDKRCHEMVVMPNHFHCIIENAPMDASITDATVTDATVTDAHVGASLRGRPDDGRGRPDNDGHPDNDGRGNPEKHYGIENKKYNATIGDAMDWFKTMTTNDYIRGVKTNNWQPYNKKIWQRNYHEHIIRDEQSYLKITNYIKNNPANWNNDSLK
jgi:putative transposase